MTEEMSAKIRKWMEDKTYVTVCFNEQTEQRGIVLDFNQDYIMLEESMSPFRKRVGIHRGWIAVNAMEDVE